jgi:hypothetical protein
VELNSPKQLYSAKTDDDLLALAVDQDSLVPEAQSLLAEELARRGLSVPRSPTQVESETTLRLEENPAFNAPAKVGQVLFALFVFGFLAFLLEVIVRRNPDWKRDLTALAVVMLLLFGPIFAAIAWATRRNLQKARALSRKRKH